MTTTHRVAALLAALCIALSTLAPYAAVARAQGQDPIPLDLILTVAPDPAADIDGAAVTVLVRARGEALAGVDVTLQSSVAGDYAGFEDGDPATLLQPSITLTTGANGRATATWGLDVCLLDPMELTVRARAHRTGYADDSASETITVMPFTVASMPPHGTETISYDVSTHKTYVSIGPSEGAVTVGDTVELTLQVGREINYEHLDLWNLPVIKGRGAVVLSIPKVNGVPVAHVVGDEVMTEVYHPLFSEDWLPISDFEDFGALVEIVEWLQLFQAIGKLNVIDIALELVPDFLYFLGGIAFGVGQGPSGPDFDPGNQEVQFDPMLWDLYKMGVESVRMRIPLHFDVDGYHEIAWFANWQYYTGNQYVENDAGAQSHVRFSVTPRSSRLDATVLRQPGILFLSPGERAELVFDIQNTGNVTWLPTEPYALVNTNGETLGASPEQPLLTKIPPGRTAQWVLPITAPSRTGLSWTAWQMALDGETFGGKAGCLVAVVPEGEFDIDLPALLGQWIDELTKQVREKWDRFFESLLEQFQAWLRRESERLLAELVESLTQQCCGAALIAPGLVLLVAGASRLGRRKRTGDRDRA